MARSRVCALALGALVTFGMFAPAQAVTPTVSVATTTTSGATVTATGKVAKGLYGQTVRLQLKVGATWYDLAKATLNPTKSYTLKAQPQLGFGYYRVRLVASGAVSNAVSKPISFIGRLGASPNPPISGEYVSITGRLPTRVPRPVILQRYSPGGWIAVSSPRPSDTVGRFMFRPHASANSFRAYAPAATIKGQKYATFASLSLAVRPTAQDSESTPCPTGRPAPPDQPIPTLSAGPSPAVSFPSASAPVVRLNRSDLTASASFQRGHGRTVSSDGRFIVFASSADNIVSGDTDGEWDSFLYDRTTGATVEITSNPARGSASPTISADGRWVAFTAASNYQQEDATREASVFVWDRVNDETQRVPGLRTSNPSISADGGSVVYEATIDDPDNGSSQAVYQWRRATGRSTMVSRTVTGTPDANARSSNPVTSADGRYVAYLTSSEQIAPLEKDSNGERVALWDRTNGSTRILNVRGSDGGYAGRAGQHLSMSENGQYVLYEDLQLEGVADGDSDHDALILWDRATGQSTTVDEGADYGHNAGVGLSPTGRFIYYAAERSATFENPEESAQVLRFDRVTGGRALVTKNAQGLPANGSSTVLGFTDDGGHAILATKASNLLAEDSNEFRDLVATAIDWATPPGATGFPVIQDDQREPWSKLAALPGDGSTQLLSHTPAGEGGDESSGRPAVSADGRYVAFASTSSDIDPADLADRDAWNHESSDVFLWDKATGAVDRITDAMDGSGGNDQSGHPSISADGRFVAFSSEASNLIPDDMPHDMNDADIFLWDRVTQQTTLVSPSLEGEHTAASKPTISADGSTVAYSAEGAVLEGGAWTTFPDLYVWDRGSGRTVRVKETDGSQWNEYQDQIGLSSNGRYVVFKTQQIQPSQRPSDVRVWDKTTGSSAVVTQGLAAATPNGKSGWPAISGDGKTVVFSSAASNLVDGDTNRRTDVFIWDAESRAICLVTRGLNGRVSDGSSMPTSISGDGSRVSFTTWAENLVPDDNNRFADVFVWDRKTDTFTRQSLRAPGVEANGHASMDSSLSPDGSFVAFSTNATNLDWPTAIEPSQLDKNVYMRKVD